VHVLEPGSFHALVLRAEPDGRSLRGQLVDVDGRPLAGIAVQCELLEARDVTPASGSPTVLRAKRREPPAPWSRVLARARTDEEGRWALHGLPRAEVVIRAAPRVGSTPAFAGRRADFEEALVGSFDLGLDRMAVDAGTSALRSR
jgi:hypothetical protein